jgi:exonuclease III
MASGLWDYLLELDPDIALLQDFGALPDHVLEQYVHAPNIRAPVANRAPHHNTGLLLRNASAKDLPLPAPSDWVAGELENWQDHFTAKRVSLPSGVALKILSVYSPAFPIDPARMQEVDTTGIQLTQSPDVWGTELLWATLRSMDIANEDPLVVAGDLNSCETLDGTGPRAAKPNREFFERMNALGLYDCLRMFQGQLTPTFRVSRGWVTQQLDHLFVTPMLLSRLTWCDVAPAERVFGPRPMLSDHLPIVADFSWPG